jgi:hypothetical protein
MENLRLSNKVIMKKCRFGPTLAMLLAACSPTNNDNATTSNESRRVAHEIAPTQSASTYAAANAEGACDRLTASEIAANVNGFVSMGTTGPFEFFARSKNLLCSEPGLNGNGECEIVGDTIIKIKHGDHIFGLHAKATAPTILKYGPNGISCAYMTMKNPQG